MKSKTRIVAIFAGLVILGTSQLGAYAVPVHGKTVHHSTHPTPPQGKTSPSGPTIWHSDPALADSLGSEVHVQDYALRIPVGYVEVALPANLAPAGFEFHMYGTAKLPDGSKSAVVLTVATPPADVKGTMSLDEALTGTIGNRTKWPNYTQSPVERGRIGTMTFERAYFKGLFTTSNGVTVLTHGLAYAAVDDNRIINLLSEASDAYYQTTLPIAEASILTFHKQPQSGTGTP